MPRNNFGKKQSKQNIDCVTLALCCFCNDDII